MIEDFKNEVNFFGLILLVTISFLILFGFVVSVIDAVNNEKCRNAFGEDYKAITVQEKLYCGNGTGVLKEITSEDKK
jgi:hypothetical protein